MALRERLDSLFRRGQMTKRSDNKHGLSFDLRIATFLFAGARADYYRYLADMLEGTRGRMSLKEIFLNDARRYGNSPRGKLSRHWANTFGLGGSFERTFRGTLPRQDIAVLGTLQQIGAEGALEDGLRDLADNTALVAQARGAALSAMAASLVCLGLVIALVLTMPAFTVPKIVNAFSMMPLSEFPQTALDLIDFADFVSANWLNICVATAVTVFLVVWSLTNMTGSLRAFCDRYLVIWGIHRDFESVRFLSVLAAMLRKRGNRSVGLRTAVVMQFDGASRWKKHHLTKMLNMIDTGDTGPALFNTGMVDRDTSFYIADLIYSRGIEDALQYVRSRLESRVMNRIKRQSMLLSWVLMMSSITLSALLMFWHMLAIDAMRTALQQYLS